MKRRFLIFLLLWPLCVMAQSMQIFKLQHRSAGDLLPELQPFVERGGVLTGMNDSLFLRASPRNQDEIRQMLAALDVPQRRLMISVRQEGDDELAARGGAVNGSITVRDGKVGAGGTARVYSSDRSSNNRLSQSVQTLDGGRASIVVGQSFWVPMRQVMVGAGGVIVADTVVQRDIGSGFVARPRLSGGQVTVEISPQQETLEGNAATGSIRSERLATTVSGALGEWLVLGGSAVDEQGQAGGASWGTRSASRQRRLLMKVEALP
jgi:type II secretory pathway component GspD/PulD (secretin)